MNQRAFSREEKLHILHQLLSGEKYLSQLSREYGVVESQLVFVDGANYTCLF